MPFLTARHLAKAFDGRRALADLSFAVARGEVYTLVGPNGAGKTTTINLICCVLRQDGGEVLIDGAPVSPATRSRIGIAPQEIALYRELTALENVVFFAGLYGLRGTARERRAAACLEAVGLGERADSVVSQLSGGMQRRLHIAVALLHEPPLLILDEPTVGLDVDARHRVWKVIAGLQRGGCAILLTTHQLDEAEALSSRIGILSQGLLAAEGSMDELRRLIPAAELAVVEAADLSAVRERAAGRGLTCRDAPHAVTVWLPHRMELRAVAGYFDGIPLRSLRLKPVGLAEVFGEVAQASH
jgi:ABC-2 type transport system ATP-binding protein